MTGLALALGRDQVALEYAREAVRLSPNDQRRVGRPGRGRRSRNADFAGADRTLAPLVTKRPAPPDVLVLLAAIQAARGNSDAARSTYLEALQADRDSLEALSGLVELEIQTIKWPGSSNGLNKPSPRTRKIPVPAARCTYLASCGRCEARRVDASNDPGHRSGTCGGRAVAGRRSRSTEPPGGGHPSDQAGAHAPPSSFELQVILATLLEETGQVAEARTRYEAIIAANRNAGGVSARLAALYANQRDNLDRALKLAKMAKQRLPDDPSVSDTLGWVYVRRGLPSMGAPHLKDAVRAEPSTALFRYHLGIAHQQQAKFRAARDELTRALTLDPDFPGAADARAALETLAKTP